MSFSPDPPALPHPARLALRILVVACLVLWVGHVYAAAMVQWLLPALRLAFRLLGDDFTLLQMTVERRDGFSYLLLQADFEHPVVVAGHTVQPLRWSPQGVGWFGIEQTLGGVLSGLLLLGIIILSWPSLRWWEFLLRAGFAALASALLLLNTTVTQLAELWFPVHNDLDPRSAWPLLVTSRILMSGGGLVLAGTAGICVIALARACAARALQRR